ncbi:DUF6896 domain-containing protein [Streptomyces sp. NPDC093088]|uniref:DUF6896 domain-containing protein n=1 Tax=Streptomyces sp. NPDC093088 TaxID=3366023 RepID=UPI003802D7C1
MGQVGAAHDLVLGHVRALDAIDEAMRAAIPSLERPADVLDRARSRRIGRNGRIGPYAYTVHGAGCRFVHDDGTEIDVDFSTDGSEVFDLWRLRRYGLSLPKPLEATDEGLRAAVRSLYPLLTEVRPGWWAVRRRSEPRRARSTGEGPTSSSPSARPDGRLG